MNSEDDPHAASWRDQLIELDLPGVGPITACADPRLQEDPAPGGSDATGSDGPGPDQQGFRRRPPTTPAEREVVRATLRGRVPLQLEHSWLVLPALGPVLPTLRPEGEVVTDLSGRRAPFEARSGPAASAPATWFRRPDVADALRRRGGMVALGALVGPRREWFEPAAAVREDLLAPHPDQALEVAVLVAREQGQGAVLRIGADQLDLVPTGSDPRVPHLEGLGLLVTARPAQCPLQGRDGCGPCRPHGGPWVRSAQHAQVEWQARRDQALAVQGCGVCFGEALPPETDQPSVPCLSHRLPVSRIDRLHLRSGEVVRIDPLDPPGAGAPR